jgi:glycosyltransferase involved in cell wall biosynthesis
MNPLITIAINNYNYAAFLPAAIESALRQTYSPVEIVVVDDGSTDESASIIASYGDRVVPVLKPNGGQASAFNAGVARSRGEIVCFLDSDDCFTPDKVAQMVAAFEKEDFRSKPMMIHHPLTIMGDGAGEFADQLIGRKHESPLNQYEFARRFRFLQYMGGPTSGLSLNRSLTDRMFPIPEVGVRTSADDFIVYGASLIGDVYLLDKALGSYRIHGHNAWFLNSGRKSWAFNETLDKYLNKILVENGRQPVMSFPKSMSCWNDLALERRWLALSWHIVRLAVLQHNLYTVRYAHRALRLALRLAIKGQYKGQPKTDRSNIIRRSPS